MITKHNWTNEQSQIFTWFSSLTNSGAPKFAMAKALPGCTKTSTSIEGINRLQSGSVLYTVFGKRNQLEAEEKISNRNVSVKTIHSFGLSFVTANWRGVRGDFSTEWNRVKQLYPDAPKQVILQLTQLVAKLKNTYINPTNKNAIDLAIKFGIDGGNHSVAYPQDKMAEMAMNLIKLSTEYPKDKLISFDDMIWLPARMGWVKPTHDFVLIDEAQDVNEPQFSMLTGASKRHMFIVGDPNQAIYGFRGAMPDSMDKFKTTLNTTDFKLTTNFRCGKNIINYAQTYMPELQAGPNAIDGIVELINEEKAIAKIKVKDAILSRTNAPLMPMCLRLLRNKIPAYIEGKDIGKTLSNIVESLEASNVNEFFDKLAVWQNNKVQRASGWFAAQAIQLATDQAETLRVLAEQCVTVPEITQKLDSLFMDADKVRVPSVVLSTVHKFKGREANNVNLLVESFKRKPADAQEAIEEQNIYKVAITRARERMSLVSTQ